MSWQTYSCACLDGKLEVGIALYAGEDTTIELMWPAHFQEQGPANDALATLEVICEKLNS